MEILGSPITVAMQIATDDKSTSLDVLGCVTGPVTTCDVRGTCAGIPVHVGVSFVESGIDIGLNRSLATAMSAFKAAQPELIAFGYQQLSDDLRAVFDAVIDAIEHGRGAAVVGTRPVVVTVADDA